MTTMFLAGSIQIVTFIVLSDLYNLVLSLGVVAAISGIFLVCYRSKKTKVHRKITLLDTFTIIVVATIASII
jgi:hypothetical protein